MKILVLETNRHAANHAVRTLEAAGHEVARCHDAGDAAFPCHGLARRSDGTSACPLDRDGGVDAVLTVRAHPYPQPTPLEDGVSCALRRHLPLVVAGNSALDPFEPWATEVVDGVDADLVAACERAAQAPIRRCTEMATAEVQRLVDDPDHAGEATSTAEVHRADGGLRAVVHLPADAPEHAAALAGVRVAGVVRAMDPTARSVDVTVRS